MDTRSARSIEQPSNPYERVGRLASLGIEEPWQAALYLPNSYIDCSRALESPSAFPTNEKFPVVLTLIRPATPVYRNGPPRLNLAVRDENGKTWQACIFGDTKTWMEKLRVGDAQLFTVSTKIWRDQLQLTIHDVHPNQWVGRIIPVYPANKNIIEPDTLRGVIQRWLPNAIPIASQNVINQLEQLAPMATILDRIGATGWSVDQLITQAHYPSEGRYVTPTRMALMRLAALGSLCMAGRKSTKDKRTPNPIRLGHVERLIVSMPFMLTDDQTAAIRGLAADIASPLEPAKAVCSGDVGTGKSCAIGVIAAAAAAEGRTSYLLFPTSLLAEQHYKDFKAWFPDTPMTLITGETGGDEDLDAPILMGTSALLHRKLGKPDILMIDEQHKWSRAQREQYLGRSTHLIELSATCIPRTQALMRFGHVSLYQMRKTHRPKRIHTRIWEGREEARELTEEISKVVREGQPVFIIYPQRKRTESTDSRHNVNEAEARWHQLFPGLVRSLTSENSLEEMTSALNDIVSGKARVLISTTVVEVGVNVPNLRHLVVVNPERHGLTGLHQLRGRVARQGGEGWFHLLSPAGLPDQSRDRLQVLVRTSDGFEVAEEDLRLRGAGDLRGNSSRQSGSDGNFLLGMKIDLEIYDQMADLYGELQAAA